MPQSPFGRWDGCLFIRSGLAAGTFSCATAKVFCYFTPSWALKINQFIILSLYMKSWNSDRLTHLHHGVCTQLEHRMCISWFRTYFDIFGLFVFLLVDPTKAISFKNLTHSSLWKCVVSIGIAKDTSSIPLLNRNEWPWKLVR